MSSWKAIVPSYAITKVLKLIVDQQRLPPWVTERSVSPTAVISPLALVDERVAIGAGAVIEPFCVVDNDVSIGCGSVIRSGVRIHSRVAIGDASIVGVNTIVGHQGFGFVRDESGNKTRIPHLGGVVIGSNVEIGALVTIPSGTITPTVIEDGSKVDDHVHVGHNVRIERGASVTAGTIIGGSVIIGEEAWIGINSSIRDGRRVGCRSLVGMDASVQEDLDDLAVARAPRPDVKTRLDDDSSDDRLQVSRGWQIGFQKGTRLPQQQRSFPSQAMPLGRRVLNHNHVLARSTNTASFRSAFESAVDGEDDRLTALPHAKLVEDIGDVIANCLFTDCNRSAISALPSPFVISLSTSRSRGESAAKAGSSPRLLPLSDMNSSTSSQKRSQAGSFSRRMWFFESSSTN